jgi:hypothetical protein
VSREEEIRINEEGDVDFDFGFENFRAMGFQYTGVLKQCRVKQPEKAEYSFVDRKTGTTVTKKAKPQLELLIEPLSFATKSGNPIPEYLPLTHNVRSKLGIFVEGLRNLGLSLGNDPSRIEGTVFEWEVKEVDFGGTEPVKVNVPIEISGASATSAPVARTSAPAHTAGRPTLTDEDKVRLATVLSGVSQGSELAAVAGSTFGSNARVIAGIADRTLITSLVEDGLVSMGADGQYTAAAA